MKRELEKKILEITGSTNIKERNVLQSLWSGYGTLERIKLENTSIILKLIQLNHSSHHPRGWNSDVGHLRKTKSYQIEMNWYQFYGRQIKEAHYPKMLDHGELKSGEQYLILEDLALQNLTPKNQISKKEMELCLSWLAAFHKEFLGKVPAHLWNVGTYWHLATRAEELKKMSDLPLKNAAKAIDSQLNSAQYKTIVHGDAKLANFLFGAKKVAAVDFQYVGGGVGVKDLAYFLSSVYNEDELAANEKFCLDFYFSQLNHKSVEKEWRELYPYAWCDFYRFLQGWAPQHHKINNYSEEMKEKVLKWI